MHGVQRASRGMHCPAGALQDSSTPAVTALQPFIEILSWCLGDQGGPDAGNNSAGAAALRLLSALLSGSDREAAIAAAPEAMAGAVPALASMLVLDPAAEPGMRPNGQPAAGQQPEEDAAALQLDALHALLLVLPSAHPVVCCNPQAPVQGPSCSFWSMISMRGAQAYWVVRRAM